MVATSQGPQTLLSRPFKDSRYSCPWSGAGEHRSFQPSV